MNVWAEYTMTIEGEYRVFTVKWFVSAAAAAPFHTDTFRFSLTDPAVTPDMIDRTVRDRAALLSQALTRNQQIVDRFGAGQGVRVQLA